MRYIDAEKLLNPDNIIVMQDETGIDEFPYTYTNAVKVETILNAPTSDVVEVRHGHWEYLGFDAVCSECGYINEADTVTRCRSDPPYCPKCGAKMDGERREE